MASVKFEKNKKEALENLVWDKRKSVVQGSFIVNGKPIDTDTSLSLEYVNLYSTFTYDIGETFPLQKYDRFRTVFLDLRDALESHIEEGQYDAETLKRVMVHLNLELGTDINFTDTLQTMLLEDMLDKDYSDMKEQFTFDNLYQHYTKTPKKGNQNFANQKAVGEDNSPEYPEGPNPQSRGRKR